MFLLLIVAFAFFVGQLQRPRFGRRFVLLPNGTDHVLVVAGVVLGLAERRAAEPAGIFLADARLYRMTWVAGLRECARACAASVGLAAAGLRKPLVS